MVKPNRMETIKSIRKLILILIFLTAHFYLFHNFGLKGIWVNSLVYIGFFVLSMPVIQILSKVVGSIVGSIANHVWFSIKIRTGTLPDLDVSQHPGISEKSGERMIKAALEIFLLFGSALLILLNAVIFPSHQLFSHSWILAVLFFILFVSKTAFVYAGSLKDTLDILSKQQGK